MAIKTRVGSLRKLRLRRQVSVHKSKLRRFARSRSNSLKSCFRSPRWYKRNPRNLPCLPFLWHTTPRSSSMRYFTRNVPGEIASRTRRTDSEMLPTRRFESRAHHAHALRLATLEAHAKPSPARVHASTVDDEGSAETSAVHETKPDCITYASNLVPPPKLLCHCYPCDCVAKRIGAAARFNTTPCRRRSSWCVDDGSRADGGSKKCPRFDKSTGSPQEWYRDARPFILNALVSLLDAVKAVGAAWCPEQGVNCSETKLRYLQTCTARVWPGLLRGTPHRHYNAGISGYCLAVADGRIAAQTAIQW